jgi:peptide/nickel transport system substrate-binding protein
MRKIFLVSAMFLLILILGLSSLSLAQEWALRKPRGTLKVVAYIYPSAAVAKNYAEHLVDDRTIEFRLRKGVTFHNGEEFNAEAVRINWEEYRKMETPRVVSHTMLPDETILEIVDKYTVRFIFPEPEGLAFVKFWFFYQIAPGFFKEHKFEEKQWGYVSEAGPWGTGPFRLVEGGALVGKPSDRAVLEAYEGYWNPQYPKVRKVIFENLLAKDRKEAMRLCMESEGELDIVSHIRPLDTLKVAESRFAKVVKSKDTISLYGFINQRVKGSKWRDIRLRKALNYAINRKELWKYAAKGNAYNLGGFIPPEAYGHKPHLDLYTYDTNKARSLLAEAGYPGGFKIKLITWTAWELEARIISRMMERISLDVELDVLTHPEYWRKTYHPILDKPPEEQDWDITIHGQGDYYGHPGASILPYPFLEESNARWIEYDPVYEKSWKEMATIVDPSTQEEKLRQLVEYVYDQAHVVFIYSPLTLYAVNKEVNFVPQKSVFVRLMETSVTDSHWSVREQE